MDDLWVRNDRPIPASYWLAAGLGSLVVVVCYATGWWVPWFVRDFASAALAGGTFRISSVLALMFGGSMGVAFGAAPLLALRWPAPAIGLALLPVPVALIDPQSPGLHFGVFATLCAIAITASWRDMRAALVAAALAQTVIVGWLFSGGRMAAPFRADVRLEYFSGSRIVLGLVYAIAVGIAVLGAWGLRRSAEREIERRSLAARAGEVEEQSAVVRERSRLARDLHDVVAHHVSLIAVRAETAPYTHPDLGEPARGVLADIAADARLALDELRGVLGILGRSGAGERSPQPTWSDITALVERTRSAGVDIDVVGDATADVSPSAGYAAYRVVQEALTNARKHAPDAPVALDLEATSQLLTVRVSTPLGAAPATSSSGQGLVGMRERVEALGGRLLSGPVGDHFVVEAILPRVVAQVPA